MILDLSVLLVFPFVMAVAASSDLVSMTISNRLQLVLVGTFFVAAAAAGLDWQTVGLHVGAGMLVLAITFGCFACGWIGGGDAKLMAATALWFGFGMPLAEYVLISTVYGGALTVAILYLRKEPLPGFLAGQSWVVRLHDEKTGIPYGIALAAGALTVFPKTYLFQLAVQP